MREGAFCAPRPWARCCSPGQASLLQRGRFYHRARERLNHWINRSDGGQFRTSGRCGAARVKVTESAPARAFPPVSILSARGRRLVTRNRRRNQCGVNRCKHERDRLAPLCNGHGGTVVLEWPEWTELR